MLDVCPTDVVRASTERVWHLITTPGELERWTRTTLIEAPDRQVRAGDRLVFGGIGRRMKILFLVQGSVRLQRLAIDVHLPFGIINHEVIEITAVTADACRVTFN